MLLALHRLRGGRVGVRRRDLPRLVAVTLLMIVATYSLLFWGIARVPTGLAAIVNMGLMPLTLLAIGAALGEDRFTLVRTLGLALGMAGLGVLFGPSAFAAGGSLSGAALTGAVAILGSTFVYALGSVLARPLLGRYPPVALSGMTMFWGGLALVAGALALEPGAAAAASGDWGWRAWAGWGFLAVFGSLIGYTTFLRLVREWGASRAGAYAFVSPAVAVALGVWVMGERVDVSGLLAMAAMLAGAFLTTRATGTRLWPATISGVPRPPGARPADAGRADPG